MARVLLADASPIGIHVVVNKLKVPNLFFRGLKAASTSPATLDPNLTGGAASYTNFLQTAFTHLARLESPPTYIEMVVADSEPDHKVAENLHRVLARVQYNRKKFTNLGNVQGRTTYRLQLEAADFSQARALLQARAQRYGYGRWLLKGYSRPQSAFAWLAVKSLFEPGADKLLPTGWAV